MNNNLRFIFSLITLCFFSACQKEKAFSAGTGGNTDIASCMITGETNDLSLTDGNQFTLAYDANGLLTSVTGTNSGTPTETVAITPQEIVRTLSDYSETFDFTKNIFTGKPDAYSYSNTMNANSRTAKITYNGNQLTQVKSFDASNTLLNTVDLSYDGNENVKAITLTNGAAGSQPLSYTATSYDNNNSPYFGQNGSSLLLYNWDFYTVPDYTYIFQHLSRHNILGWGLSSNGAVETAAYTYTYNDKNYPTSISETVDNSNNGTVYPQVNIQWSYTYQCK